MLQVWFICDEPRDCFATHPDWQQTAQLLHVGLNRTACRNDATGSIRRLWYRLALLARRSVPDPAVWPIGITRD